jgi:hypothetical protein
VIAAYTAPGRETGVLQGLQGARDQGQNHFGFWIADFGFRGWSIFVFNPKSAIQNPKPTDGGFK